MVTSPIQQLPQKEKKRNLSKKGRKGKFKTHDAKRKTALKGKNTMEGELTEPKIFGDTVHRTDHSTNDKMRDGV